MRRFARTTVVFLAAGLGLVLAAPAQAAGTAVLTAGSLGGTNIPIGEQLTGHLKPGTQARFTTSSGGMTGISCSSSTVVLTVNTNPAAGGTATFSIVSLTFASCVSNLTGVTSVQSITVNNLPYTGSVNGTTKVVTITSGSGPIQFTIRLNTIVGTISCVYQTPSINGTFSNADSSVTFNVTLTKSSGPSLCPGSFVFSATYVISDNGQPVFVQ